MQTYDNTNKGSMFNNDKQGNEKRPDLKGTINVDGKEYWISGWKRKSQKGVEFMSLTVEGKQDRQDKVPF